MKKLFLLSALCLFSLAIFAQTAQSDATQMVADVAAKVNLDDDQKTKLFDLQVKLSNDLAQVQPLRDSDPEIYYNKVSTLKEMNFTAIMKMMSEDQLEDYRKSVLKANSDKRSSLYKKWKADGLSDQEIKIRLVEAM